jgi:hypothetical protein
VLRRLESIRQSVDRASARPFLWIDIGLAAFVLFSHGGALAASIAKPDRAPQGVWQVAIFSLPLALIVFVSGIVALRRSDLVPRVLAIHGLVLGASAAALLLWAVSVFVTGPGEDNFVWAVGFLTVWVAYSTYTMLRFSPSLKTAPRSVLPVTVLLALVVDVGVFVRLLVGVG